MDTLLAIGLLLLAVCVVVLFAMMGELSSRLPKEEQSGPTIRAIDEFESGRAPSYWPSELAYLSERPDRTLMVVLSTVCTSCRNVAEQIKADASRRELTDLALVISTGARDNGEDFVKEFGLGGVSHFIDVGGTWTQGEWGIRISPAGIIVQGGLALSASTFTDWQDFRSSSADQRGTMEVRNT